MLGVARSTMRYAQVPLVDEAALPRGVLEAADLYGRYGYRTVCGLLSGAGWHTSEAASPEFSMVSVRCDCLLQE